MDGLRNVAGVSLSNVFVGGMVSDAAVRLERLRMVLGVDFGCLCPVDMGIDGCDDTLSLSIDETRTNRQQQ